MVRRISPGDVKLPCNLTIERLLMRISNSGGDKLDYSVDFSRRYETTIKNWL